jgi:hypothetical protein
MLAAASVLTLLQSQPRAQAVPEVVPACIPTIPVTGDVLVIGGEDNFGNPLSGAELFHPATGLFYTACNMTVARREPLSSNILQNSGNSLAGDIIVMGGEFAKKTAKGETITGHWKTTDLYDPVTGVFTAGPLMKGCAEDTNQVQLTNGRILIAGGDKGTLLNTETPLRTAQIFNPSTGKFTAILSLLPTPRSVIAAAQIVGCGCANEGKVLLAGGAGINGNALRSAELFDPLRGTFKVTGNMNFARAHATASLLSGGKILIAGGTESGNRGPSLNTAEIYDPATGTFALTTAAFPGTGTNMTDFRTNHTATTLSDGTILIAGGENDTGPGPTQHLGLRTAEIYDPSTGSFTATAQEMTAGRNLATATLISGSGTALDGQVLIAGGEDVNFFTLDTAEIYNPSDQTFTRTTGNMAAARDLHTASPIQ